MGVKQYIFFIEIISKTKIGWHFGYMLMSMYLTIRLCPLLTAEPGGLSYKELMKWCIYFYQILRQRVLKLPFPTLI